MSSNPFTILVVTASTRHGRVGPAVARWFLDTVADTAERRGVRLVEADLARLALPLTDEPEHPASGDYRFEHTRRWSRQVAAADAFVVVLPEYNFGMPASFKNALDALYHEWTWKPVAFVSYGNTSAGTRSVQMAKQAVSTLRLVPTGATLALRLAQHLDERGTVRADAAPEGALDIVEELVALGTALAPMREATPVVDNGPLPPPADTPPGLDLARATDADLAEVLVLQRCCWVDEALANRSLTHPALQETLADVRAWHRDWDLWRVRLPDGRLVAAGRSRTVGATHEIGRLMVAPDQRGRGLGRLLLAHLERQAPAGATRLRLGTGAASTRNIALYESAGYALTGEPDAGVAGSVALVKPVPDPTATTGSPGAPVPPAARRAG